MASWRLHGLEAEQQLPLLLQGVWENVDQRLGMVMECCCVYTYLARLLGLFSRAGAALEGGFLVFYGLTSFLLSGSITAGFVRFCGSIVGNGTGVVNPRAWLRCWDREYWSCLWQSSPCYLPTSTPSRLSVWSGSARCSRDGLTSANTTVSSQQNRQGTADFGNKLADGPSGQLWLSLLLFRRGTDIATSSRLLSASTAQAIIFADRLLGERIRENNPMISTCSKGCSSPVSVLQLLLCDAMGYMRSALEVESCLERRQDQGVDMIAERMPNKKVAIFLG